MHRLSIDLCAPGSEASGLEALVPFQPVFAIAAMLPDPPPMASRTRSPNSRTLRDKQCARAETAGPAAPTYERRGCCWGKALGAAAPPRRCARRQPVSDVGLRVNDGRE